MYPEEIVSQGEHALEVYLTACSQGTVATVFLRVDVVGRDGVGKTSLTKSLTLQQFNYDELSTTGVRFDPKCQIIVKEAADWTTPLSSRDYGDMYDKNIVTFMSESLDRSEVRNEYLSSKQEKRPMRAVKDIHDSFHDSSTIGQSLEKSFEDFEKRFSMASSHVSDSHPPERSHLVNTLDRDIQISNSDFEVPPHSRQHQGKAFSKESPNDAGRLASVAESAAPRAADSTGGCVPLESEELGTDAESTAPGRQHDDDVENAEIADSANATGCTTAEQDRSVECRYLSADVERTPDTSGELQSTDHKASRLRNVPKKIKERVTDCLKDRKSIRNAKKEKVVTIVDYAGQNVFYATHRLFFAKDSFYYVVFDASQRLHSASESTFRVEGRIIYISSNDRTNYDRVVEWMSAIHVMEADDSRRIMLFEDVGIASPAMFLVGTHVDKLKDQPGELEKQDEFMRKSLEGSVLLQHVVWAKKGQMCFFVDNTLTDPDTNSVDEEVKLLRSKTEEVAQKVAQLHVLPISWLKFEQEVREVKEADKSMKTALMEELLQLAMKTAGIKDREEFMVLLRYLSNRAVLLYHPKALKSEEDEVVMDVEWLTGELEKVITIRTEHDVPPMLRNDVTRAKEKGIVTSSLIQHLLSESRSSQRLIISLMTHFDLLCQYLGFDSHSMENAKDKRDFVTATGEQGCQSHDDCVQCTAYFIPCLLEKASPLKSEHTPSSSTTMPLVLFSHDIRIPQQLFYRLLTRLCKEFPRLPVLYQNVGYFHVHQGHKLEFSLSSNILQMTVLTKSNVIPSPRVCAKIREYIVTTVDDAKQDGMAGLKVQLGFLRAAYSSSGSTAHDFVSLSGYPADRTSLYIASSGEEVDPPPELRVWYANISQPVRRLSCYYSSYLPNRLLVLFSAGAM